MEQLTYTFNELSDKAKERALQKHAEWGTDLDHIIDDARHEGMEKGFDIDDVRYSISYSQGDGASWQGRVKIGEFLDHFLKEDNPDHARYVVLRELLRDGWVVDSVDVNYTGFRYVHSVCMAVDAIADDYLFDLLSEHPDIARSSTTIKAEGVLQGADVRELAKGIDALQLLDNDLHTWITDEARYYANEIHKRLVDEYEHMTSEEFMADAADANGWRFDEDGNFV